MIRAVLAALLALLWASPAAAQFVHVQTVTETTNQFSGDANSVATVSATTVGNTIVAVIISDQNRSFSSATCGVTFTSIHRQGTSVFVEILAGVATSSVTSCSVTLTGNSSGTVPDSLTVMEFSGGAAVLAESGTSTGVENGSTTNTHTAAAVTPDTTETLFVGAAVYGGSTGGLTQDPEYTLALHGTTAFHRYIGYRIQSGSTTAQDFSSSTVTARTSRVALGALQGAAAGGGGRPPGGLLLRGIGP